MLWVPIASVKIAKLAAPPLSAGLPSGVVPSENVTVPVGWPELLGVTVAVKVTDWFRVDEVAEEVNAVLLPAFCTV